MRLAILATFLVLLGVTTGCSSSSSGGGSDDGTTGTAVGGVCGAASSWKDKCASGADACEDTIAAACSDVTSLLNPSLVDGAKSCIEKASCGTAPTRCLAQALVNATPSDAHQKLAEGFCGCLVTGKDECVAAIDSGSGASKAALAVALPLSDDVANAITDSCTGTLGCSATFSACAQGVVAKKIAEKISPDAAACLAKTVLDGAKDTTSTSGDGSSSDSSCTQKSCSDYAGKCGDHDDGCGGTINCGKCQSSSCTPKTCADLGKTCGNAPDGCGGTLSCGVCSTSCTDAQEPNNSKAAAKSLGAMTDSPDSTKLIDNLTSGDGDEDWFTIAVEDTGFDGNPLVDVDVSDKKFEVSVFYVCTNGGDASYCPNGDTQDNTIGQGCRGTGSATLKTSCSGLTDSGTAYVRIRKLASDGQCTGYALGAVVK